MVKIFHSNARSLEMSQVSDLADFKKGSWVYVAEPSDAELEELSSKFNLEADLLNDAQDLYEAPRIETDNGVVYVFTRYYQSDNQVINATEPILFIFHPDCLITIKRIEGDLFSSYTSGKKTIITTQKTKLLLQLFAAVNASYQAYITRTTRHILKVRSQLKRTDITNEVLLGLVEIEDDLNEILSALQPYAVLLRNILNGKYMRLYEEDKDLVEDLSLSTDELIELVKSRSKTLVNIRQAYDALATSDLNRTFKRLTSISIFMVIPAIFSSLYGMNVMLPLQNHPDAFWYVVGVVVVVTVLVVGYFNKKRWL